VRIELTEKIRLGAYLAKNSIQKWQFGCANIHYPAPELDLSAFTM